MISYNRLCEESRTIPPGSLDLCLCRCSLPPQLSFDCTLQASQLLPAWTCVSDICYEICCSEVWPTFDWNALITTYHAKASVSPEHCWRHLGGSCSSSSLTKRLCSLFVTPPKLKIDSDYNHIVFSPRARQASMTGKWFLHCVTLHATIRSVSALEVSSTALCFSFMSSTLSTCSSKLDNLPSSKSHSCILASSADCSSCIRSSRLWSSPSWKSKISFLSSKLWNVSPALWHQW